MVRWGSKGLHTIPLGNIQHRLMSPRGKAQTCRRALSTCHFEGQVGAVICSFIICYFFASKGKYLRTPFSRG